ncbi:MAG: hypothetical protein JRD49_14880, partial [Deltaproteobacteria bacterium]|nr:hypothetical protein [Deltaproteobacteria bacterium]
GRIHANDTYRIVRALEIFETTRKPMSASQQSHRFKARRIRTLKSGCKWRGRTSTAASTNVWIL